MKIKKNFYKTFSLLASKLMNQRQMSIYSSKYSRKDFTRHQLLTLLLLKTYVGKGYEKFIEFLEITTIPKWLKLQKIPHFTTLQKFASRQMIQELEQFLFASAKLAKKQCTHAGVDATCMRLHYASHHYEKRIERKIKKKDYMKVAIAADLDNQLIYAIKMRKKSRSDYKDFTPLWNKIKHLDFTWWFMDRGYDDQIAHQAVFDAGKKSFGDLKNKNVPIHRTKGASRKKVKRTIRHRKKNWRVLVETINSVFKKMFGSILTAKNLHTMKVEMFLKLVTYNLYRLISRNLSKINLLLHAFLLHFVKLLLMQSHILRLFIEKSK